MLYRCSIAYLIDIIQAIPLYLQSLQYNIVPLPYIVYSTSIYYISSIPVYSILYQYIIYIPSQYYSILYPSCTRDIFISIPYVYSTPQICRFAEIQKFPKSRNFQNHQIVKSRNCQIWMDLQMVYGYYGQYTQNSGIYNYTTP